MGTCKTGNSKWSQCSSLDRRNKLASKWQLLWMKIKMSRPNLLLVEVGCSQRTRQFPVVLLLSVQHERTFHYEHGNLSKWVSSINLKFGCLTCNTEIIPFHNFISHSEVCKTTFCCCVALKVHVSSFSIHYQPLAAVE